MMGKLPKVLETAPYRYSTFKNKKYKGKYPIPKIIVIGDIHGDIDALKQILRKAGIISKTNDYKWIAPKGTYVIQMGDLIDGKRPEVQVSETFSSKPTEIDLFKYVYNLHRLARTPKHKGAFLSILGNHELMPYFARSNPEWIRQYSKKADIDEWGGLKERTYEFLPGRKYGKFLGKTRNVAIQIGKFVFVHGGLRAEIIRRYKSLYNLNKEMSQWLQGKIKKPPFYMNDDSNEGLNPLTNRQFSDDTFIHKLSNYKENYIYPILKALPDMEYMVVGHSYNPEGITIKNDHIILTDVGISRAFGNLGRKVQALEIINNGEKFNIV